MVELTFSGGRSNEKVGIIVETDDKESETLQEYWKRFDRDVEEILEDYED